ncbi:hypothetical protein [Deinococcus humi]|uniref:Uncharacterized protein n=1 Tax=Deinococcus humi TaxID=662880 RepID=A0A7W8JZI5_9DEIO|nr:hypothetical protein [Deinococcus humi]MBB5366112.1 hypothetical protein [Deinococcus humi]GGO42001.1 hypothetical protein GCM10008949_53560 [Deinococcus humi]
MNETLHGAIERLYEVFSSYAMPAHVDMSPYRDPDRVLGALRTFPLRSVPSDGLDAYAFCAITTVGDENLLRYALPRLLELMVRRELLPNEEIVLSKLELAGWRTWPEPEYAALEMFFDAWWVSVLDTSLDGSDWRAETALCAFAQANLSLTRFLQVWEAREDVTATNHLASTVRALYDSERGELVTTNFWDARPGQGAQVRLWLARPEMLTRLEDGERQADKRDDEELMENYEMALAALRIVLGA